MTCPLIVGKEEMKYMTFLVACQNSTFGKPFKKRMSNQLEGFYN